MHRVNRCDPLAILVGSLLLIATAILPFGGGARAASPQTTCPSGEGGPQCILVISAPESVPAGQPFTVQVFVTTDGTTLARSDPCASKVTVELDVYVGEGPVTTYFADASAAIATFNITGLAFDPSPYTLHAHVGELSGACSSYSFFDAFASVMAANVPAGQPIFPCPNNVSCDQVASGSGSAATLFADEGTFTASFGPLVGEGCEDGGPQDPNGVLTFSLDVQVEKTIVLALSPSLVTHGIGRYNICYGSNNPFTTRDGETSEFDPNVGLWIGYLPNCNPDVPAPCVLFRKSGPHNDAFFGIRARPGDPLAYPGI